MAYIIISPQDEPLKNGESWWIIHPNDGELEFKVPRDAWVICLKSWEGFVKGIVYQIVSNDSDNGYISILSSDNIYKMPYYVFARYFDANSLIRRANRNKYINNNTPNTTFTG
jgi:hypothetical protein